MGIGMSFVAWPSVGVVGRHLPHKRGLALGLVVGGSSIGGVIWPIMLDRMLAMEALGFPWTIRIIGFTMLALLLISTATISEPKDVHKTAERSNERSISPSSATNATKDMEATDPAPPGIKEQHKMDFAILRNKSFLFLCAGIAVAYLGLFGPFFFVSSYATLHDYASDSMAFYLISMLNASSLLGRVLPGILADKYGHFNLCILALFASAIIAFCWTAVHGLGGLIVFSIAYGFASGVRHILISR